MYDTVKGTSCTRYHNRGARTILLKNAQNIWCVITKALVSSSFINTIRVWPPRLCGGCAYMSHIRCEAAACATIDVCVCVCTERSCRRGMDDTRLHIFRLHLAHDEVFLCLQDEQRWWWCQYIDACCVMMMIVLTITLWWWWCKAKWRWTLSAESRDRKRVNNAREISHYVLDYLYLFIVVCVDVLYILMYVHVIYSKVHAMWYIIKKMAMREIVVVKRRCIASRTRVLFSRCVYYICIYIHMYIWRMLSADLSVRYACISIITVHSISTSA